MTDFTIESKTSAPLTPEERLEKASLLAEKLAKLSPSEYVARQHTMIHSFKILDTLPIHPGTLLHHPEAQDHLITLDSPAINVLTDFKSAPGETIHPETSLAQGLAEMRAVKVKSLLVIDDEGRLLGLVSLKDLQGLRAGRMAQFHGITPAELTVSQVMTPVDKLEAIDFKLLANARVGHIAKLVHEHDLQHLLVVDHDELGIPKVRGIFSATRIARQLGIDSPLGTQSSHSLGDMHRTIQ